MDTLDAIPATLTIPTFPPAEALFACAGAALIAAMILVGVFGPFMAVASECITVKTKRAFFARTARQTASMALLAGALATLTGGSFMVWFAMNEPALLAPPYAAPLGITAGAVVVGLLLLAVYVRRPQGALLASKGHAILGITAAVWAGLALFLSTGAVRRLLHTPPEFDPATPQLAQIQLFFAIPFDSFFWPLLLESVPLGLALAAASACVWLLLVRNRQDYGRDYYAFALPYCAKWAVTFTPLAVLVGMFVFFESRKIMLPELSQDPSLLLDVLSAALPLIACLFWLFIIRSEHPMRHKVSVVLAWLFLLTGFAGQVLMLNKIIPSP